MANAINNLFVIVIIVLFFQVTSRVHEIESEKVDAPEDFRALKHIHGVRLHFLPESRKGRPELYQDIMFER